MKKTICILMVLLLGTFALAGCSSGKGGDPNETTVVKTEDGGYQFTVPGDWSDQAGALHAEAELQVGKSNQEAFAMALIEDKADFTFDLKGYTDVVVGEMVSPDVLEGATSTDPVETKIGDNNAILTEIDGSTENLNIHYWVYCVENDEHFVQLIGWTLKSDAEKYKDEVIGVLESFQFNDTAE